MSDGPRTGVPDLGALKKPVELPAGLREEALLAGELKLGLRCIGCNERVQHGFQLAVLEVGFAAHEGRGTIHGSWVTVCSSRECGAAAKLIADGKAVAMREVRHRFLDTGELGALLRAPMPTEEVGPDGH